MPERKNGANSQSYLPKSVINSESSGGLELKKEKLNSLKFKTALAESRIHFWRNFHRIFPDIDISDQLDAAFLERDEEIARTEEEARLAEIEARLLAG